MIGRDAELLVHHARQHDPVFEDRLPEVLLLPTARRRDDDPVPPCGGRAAGRSERLVRLEIERREITEQALLPSTPARLDKLIDGVD